MTPTPASQHGAFAEDYFDARQRFHAAASARGMALTTLPIDARGPNGEALGIDIAHRQLDPGMPVLVLQSGVHGVEALAGAAIQLDCLQRGVARSAVNLVLVCVVNPFGAAWLRRTNENNVDLNRNCLHAEDDYTGAAPGYRALRHLLNPQSPPRFDLFALRASLKVMWRGRRAAIQAVAMGQYDYPRGLFFGGHRLEAGPRLYRDWLRRQVSVCARVLVLDLHTGLGGRGRMSIFAESRQPPDGLAAALAPWWIAEPAASPGYDIRGGIVGLFEQTTRGVDYLTVEFGTCPPLRVLHALREENRWHFYGGGALAHPTKRRLREALCPADGNWRRAVLAQGHELVERSLDYLSGVR